MEKDTVKDILLGKIKKANNRYIKRIGVNEYRLIKKKKYYDKRYYDKLKNYKIKHSVYTIYDENLDEESEEYDLYLEILKGYTHKSMKLKSIKTILSPLQYSKCLRRLLSKAIKGQFVKNKVNLHKCGKHKCRLWHVTM